MHAEAGTNYLWEGDWDFHVGAMVLSIIKLLLLVQHRLGEEEGRLGGID